MDAMNKLLGTKLLSSDNSEVDTSAALAGVDVVGIYFSAHWCPPCRGFTPKLAEFFNKHAKAKNFQIVFASSDSDAASFSSYFKEMPWLALPYGDRDRKEKLSKKYKVNGIPSLVFVDAKTGATITTDGRSGVMSGIENFPYKPRTWADFLSEDEAVVAPAGDKPATTFSAAAAGKKLVAFYFSAHWCPPCRAFTPELGKWYNEHKSDEFELFFVSADKGEAEFASYHKEMPFPAMAFTGRAKDDLSALFEVGGYPTLVVCDAATGKVVCGDARGRVSSEPDAFPWAEKAVEPLESSLGSINDVPLAILLVDKAEKGQPETAEMAFRAVAEEIFADKDAAAAAAAAAPRAEESCAEGAGGGAGDNDDEGEGEDDDDKRVRFAIGKAGDGSVARLREFFGLSADTAGVRLFVSAIPQGKKFVWAGNAVPTADDIRAFIKDVKSGKNPMDLRKAPAAA